MGHKPVNPKQQGIISADSVELKDLLHCSKIEVNENGQRTCACCGKKLTLKEFHKSGNGQLRGKCKRCCNTESHLRRQSKNDGQAHSPIESLPVELVVGETRSSWVNYLFSVMRAQGYFDRYERQTDKVSIDDLLKRENTIYDLIGKEGKS